MGMRKFCNFNRRRSSVGDISLSFTWENIPFWQMMMPDGFRPVDRASDTILGLTAANISIATGVGGGSDRSFGIPGFATSGVNIQTSTGYPGNCPSIAIAKTDIGGVDHNEIWFTMDWRGHGTVTATLDNAGLVRTEKRYQVFAWGDLSVRLIAFRNYTTVPTARCDIVFGLFNGATQLSELVVPSVSISSTWVFLKIHAKLNNSTGALEVTADGISSSHTNINTVATTAASSPDAEYLYFGSGHLGVTVGFGAAGHGLIDNLYIDDVGFPSGRPVNRPATLTSDHSVTGWSTYSGGAVSAQLSSGSGITRGNGVGNKAEINFTISATGLLADVLGVLIQPVYVSNTDLDDSKRMSVGLVHSGVYNMGAKVAGQIPPTIPSYIDPGLEEFVFRTGTTLYTVAGINNNTTKLVLEVINP